MFSGIVEGAGTVVSLGSALRTGSEGPLVHRLRVRVGELLSDTQPGASVAINGVCLTLVERHKGEAGFDVVVETIKRTNLSRLQPGQRVNLERSLRPNDRIDGHFVQGHVDALGVLQRIDRRGGEHKLWITADESAMRYVIPKGSVALDGVSLTIVDVQSGCFSVVLIPTTLECTTFGARREGDMINIETDIISRTVVHHLQQLPLDNDESLRKRLADSGFMP